MIQVRLVDLQHVRRMVQGYRSRCELRLSDFSFQQPFGLLEESVPLVDLDRPKVEPRICHYVYMATYLIFVTVATDMSV